MAAGIGATSGQMLSAAGHSAATMPTSRASSLRGSRDPNSQLTSPTEPRRPGVLRGTSTATGATPGGPPSLRIDASHMPLSARRESTRTTDRTDALWAEMQATLEEVELSASGGTRVFGPDHDRKLSELRAAQIALAQAWARSEADDTIETGGEARAMKSADVRADGPGAGKADGGAGAADSATKSTAGMGAGRPGSSGVGGSQERLGARLDGEIEVDILHARKRREANDRYFQRVNQGVKDVVAKLEEVAVAMRAVEQESKEIWGGGESGSVPGSARS